MFKLIGKVFLLYSVFIVSDVACAEWQLIGTSKDPDFSVYIDAVDVKGTQDGNVTVWTLTDYAKKQAISGQSESFKSRLIFWEIDCKRELAKRLTINSYTGEMGSGLLIKSEEVRGSWMHVSPREVEKKGFEISCKKPF